MKQLNIDKQTIKTIIDIILLAILAYTAYILTSPQGTELTECRTYAPGIQLIKNCSQDFNETGALLCVDRTEYAYRTYARTMPSWWNNTGD